MSNDLFIISRFIKIKKRISSANIFESVISFEVCLEDIEAAKVII